MAKGITYKTSGGHTRYSARHVEPIYRFAVERSDGLLEYTSRIDLAQNALDRAFRQGLGANLLTVEASPGNNKRSAA